MWFATGVVAMNDSIIVVGITLTYLALVLWVGSALAVRKIQAWRVM